jgi:hypothetical protein
MKFHLLDFHLLVGCKMEESKDLLIVRQDVDNKLEGLSPKRMLKVYNNLNTFQCFSEFVIRNQKVKITIRPPEQAFICVMEFLDAIELKAALNSVAYLSCQHAFLRIKITASFHEKSGCQNPTEYKYNIRMNESFELGSCKGPMNSDTFFNGPVNKIDKLVILGGDEGRFHQTVFTHGNKHESMDF